MEGSLKVILEQLEDLFEKFNEKFYNGELERPVIAVSPDITAGAYGWCTSWKAWKKRSTESRADGEEVKDDGYYEINMCAEHLTRPFYEICGTLLHEMVHLWNLQNEVKDTSRGGTYHNKKFKEEAEKRGLIIERSVKYGWTITHLNEEAKEFIDNLTKREFDLYRTPMSKSEKAKAKKKSSSRKYVCPICKQSIRATKETNILCGYCSAEGDYVKMELEENEEDEEDEV